MRSSSSMSDRARRSIERGLVAGEVEIGISHDRHSFTVRFTQKKVLAETLCFVAGIERVHEALEDDHLHVGAHSQRAGDRLEDRFGDGPVVGVAAKHPVRVRGRAPQRAAGHVDLADAMDRGIARGARREDT